MITGSEIIENSPLPMAATEGLGHKILFANPAFCALQGKTAGEMIGRPVSEAISGADAGDLISLLDGVYGGDKSGFVNHLQYSDLGRVLNYKSYMTWGFPATGDHMEGLVIQVTDFTKPAPADDQHNAHEVHQLNHEIRQINERLVISAVHQQTLAEIASGSELRLRSLVHGLDAIVCEIDALTETFTFVSERAESFLGYSIERWNEDGFWKQIVHPDDYETAMSALHTQEAGPDGFQFTFRATAADGSEIVLHNVMNVVRNADGDIVKRRCVIVDATEQHSANATMTRELERNRAIAEAMQYSILWQQPEKRFPGLRVAAFYEPVAGDALVGGDFFDAFKLNDQLITLVVGDVTGKGLKAATRTVEVTFALRAFAHDYTNPADILSRLNQFICDHHRDDYDDGDESVSNALIVLSLAVVNTTTGIAQVASAGAEPPLIVRASGVVETVSVKGLILGINRKAEYEMREVSLCAGDTLLMTTDGITEARQGRDFFGYERLLETAAHAAGLETPYDTGKTILEAVRAYAGGRFTDDVCLLLVRRESV